MLKNLVFNYRLKVYGIKKLKFSSKKKKLNKGKSKYKNNYKKKKEY
jgi:hypothetical protein